MTYIIKFYIKKILKILSNLLNPIVNRNFILKRNFQPIYLAGDFVFSENIDGDYLEFGVFKGDSFIEAYEVCENAKKWNSKKFNQLAFENKKNANDNFERLNVKKDMRYFAFDSFEGLPKETGEDGKHPRFHEGRFKSSKNFFLSSCKLNNLDLSKVIVCEGFYENSLNKNFLNAHNLHKAAIVMIDCDLLSSTKQVLNFITPILQNGTILIFDDWFTYKGIKNKGQQKAVSDWLIQNKDISIVEHARYGKSQKSFIVNIGIE